MYFRDRTGSRTYPAKATIIFSSKFLHSMHTADAKNAVIRINVRVLDANLQQAVLTDEFHENDEYEWNSSVEKDRERLD